MTSNVLRSQEDEVISASAGLCRWLNPLGIFRCADGTWLINRVDSQSSFRPSSYRRDSRLEIIKDQPTSGWPEFESKLLECQSSHVKFIGAISFGIDSKET